MRQRWSRLRCLPLLLILSPHSLRLLSSLSNQTCAKLLTKHVRSACSLKPKRARISRKLLASLPSALPRLPSLFALGKACLTRLGDSTCASSLACLRWTACLISAPSAATTSSAATTGIACPALLCAAYSTLVDTMRLCCVFPVLLTTLAASRTLSRLALDSHARTERGQMLIST